MLIDVAIITWCNHPARLDYFNRTSASLKRFLTARGHTLRILCSSESEHDPTRQWCGNELALLCRDRGIELSWRPKPASLGANQNAALRLCTGDVAMLVQDDIHLCEPLDLGPGAEYLVAHQDVDLIRYSWPGDLTKFLPGNRDGWQRVDVTRGYSYSDDPSLRRPDFMARHGWYTETGKAWDAEINMLDRLHRDRAVILASQKIYFGNDGAVSAVPLDQDGRQHEVSR